MKNKDSIMFNSILATVRIDRYYGYYSSKSRGIRCKQGIFRPGDEIAEEITRNAEIINVSEYKPCRIPSKTRRECIKKIWNQDPLCCPHCGSAMKIISFIEKGCRNATGLSSAKVF